MSRVLDHSEVQKIAGFRGRLINPSDPEYDAARAVWNGMIDKRPALVARCQATADVVAALNYARASGLEVSVRGGGHNVAGYATSDGGVVIDLSGMKAIEVDAEARIARAGGGATWADLDQRTQAFGLATPGGEVSKTGIAGLTLSGGIGGLRRKYGLSCDNLLSAEVVTADGRVLTASRHENSDLFWAIRGGGGNFGIVTEFAYQLHPVGPDLQTITVAYPFETARWVLETWYEFTTYAPEEASTTMIAWSIPAVPDFPSELHGQPIIVLDGMYAGDSARGERLFKPLRQLAEPIFDLSGLTPYLSAQSAFDDFFPDGFRYYWKSLYINEITDSFVDTLLRWVQIRPSLHSPVAMRHLGGAISRVGETDTAFGNRDAQFNLSIDASWKEPADDDANIMWAREFWEAMRPLSNGAVYLNFPGLLEEGTDIVKGALGINYDRLTRIKAKYDPSNLFSLNQNIPPSGYGSPAS